MKPLSEADKAALMEQIDFYSGKELPLGASRLFLAARSVERMPFIISSRSIGRQGMEPQPPKTSVSPRKPVHNLCPVVQ